MLRADLVFLILASAACGAPAGTQQATAGGDLDSSDALELPGDLRQEDLTGAEATEAHEASADDAGDEPDANDVASPIDGTQSPDAEHEAPELASLQVEGASLETAFSPRTTEYVARLPLTTTRVLITASPASDAVVEIDGQPLATDGNVVELPVGETLVEVSVRAEEAVRTYRLTMRRGHGVEAYLKPAMPQPHSECGAAVAVSGDSLVVGCARGAEDDGNTGIAFVFRRTAQGWTLEATLTASTPRFGDQFGTSVAIDDDTIVVGAPGERSESGAVYGFRRSGGGLWTRWLRLTAPSVGSLDGFGRSVALSGDRILVGAPGEDGSSSGVDGPIDEALPGAGAAFVFVIAEDDSCSLDAYLKAVEPSRGAGFGSVVALDGDDAVVSALLEDVRTDRVDAAGSSVIAPDSGAIYLFRREAGSWKAGPQVAHPSPRTGDRFGHTVSLSNGYLAVGAPGDDSGGVGIGRDTDDTIHPDSGAVVVFGREAQGNWSQVAFIKSPSPSARDRFGTAVALGGELLVVGASTEDGSGIGLNPPRDEAASSAGAAYLFRRTHAGWQTDAYLKASRSGAGDRFGFAVGLSPVGVVVGAPYEDSNAAGVGGDEVNDDAPSSGAVYVLR